MPTRFDYPAIETQKELKCIAESLVSPGKGILAADESPWKMGKRLEEIGVANSEEIRRQWRELLFSTDPSISKNISGVLLGHETLYEKDSNGRLFIELLQKRCIIPGIRVDRGLVYLHPSNDELGTQGLDDLERRLAQYKTDGCEFARWRSVFKIGDYTPSYRALVTNADMIARFASFCQSQKMCPIIEPEVIPDGSHSIERCQKVTETVLSFVFKALNDHHVFLDGVILKPNMIMAGLSHKTKSKPEEIGLTTIATLRRVVPPAIMGICFSSGGQTEEEATINLNAINLVAGLKPWKLTFAYGRALQASALRVWSGKDNNIRAAQDIFLKRARANGIASEGKYPVEENIIVSNNISGAKFAPSLTTPVQTQVTIFQSIVDGKLPHMNCDFIPSSLQINHLKSQIDISPKLLKNNFDDDENVDRLSEKVDESECNESVKVDVDENFDRLSEELDESECSESVKVDVDENVDCSSEVDESECSESDTVDVDENGSVDNLSNKVENFDSYSSDENDEYNYEIMQDDMINEPKFKTSKF